MVENVNNPLDFEAFQKMNDRTHYNEPPTKRRVLLDSETSGIHDIQLLEAEIVSLDAVSEASDKELKKATGYVVSAIGSMTVSSTCIATAIDSPEKLGGDPVLLGIIGGATGLWAAISCVRSIRHTAAGFRTFVNS